MSWDFHVGQRVVCVKDVTGGLCAHAVSLGAELPRKGRIYTLRQIGPRLDEPGELFVRLVEIVNPCMEIKPYLPGEPVFYASWFRPLVTRKADISIFTAILNGHRIPEDA